MSGIKDQWDRDSWAGELRLQGKFDAFGQQHQVLFGLEKNNQDQSRMFGQTYGYIGYPETFSGNFSDYSNYLEEDIPTDINNDTVIENTAAYAQIMLNLSERTNLLISARYDKAIQSISYEGFDEKEKQQELSSRLGLTHRFNNNISFYAIYAESFSPVLENGRNGLLDPETGVGYELGIKSEWFDNRLSATLAAYRQDLDDRPLEDPTNSRDEAFSISSGRHRTEGVELEISGSPFPGLTVAASASWIDNEFTEKEDLYYKLSIDGSVDKQFSLYADYQWQNGALKDFALGTTVVIVGDRQAINEDTESQVYFDGYDRVDVNLSYHGFSNWDISLLIRNVTDEKYIEVANPGIGFGNYFGSPTAALFKASYHFD